MPRPLNFKILSPNGQLPTKGHADDAAFDLYTSEAVTFEPGDTWDVPTGVAVEFPPGVWGLIVGRSSTLRERGLHVNLGVIDTGYRGELFVNAHMLVKPSFVVNGGVQGGFEYVAKGHRIGQLILLNNATEAFEATEVLSWTSEGSRGANGFGSTGR